MSAPFEAAGLTDAQLAAELRRIGARLRAIVARIDARRQAEREAAATAQPDQAVTPPDEGAEQKGA